MISSILDKIINLLKWPAALLALLFLPALYQSFDYFNFNNIKFLALVGGVFMFFVARTSVDAGVKTSMQIIAHELTHSFFALLTFHRVKHIRVAEDNSGGSMGFLGEGNWLITISPYFFPLFCFCFMLGVGFYLDFGGGEMNWVLSATFGYFIGYHMDTVGSQIHEKQTDLKKVGYPFCVTFLPGANFWMLGSMLAYNSNGWESFFRYQTLIWQLTMSNLKYALSFI